MIHIRQFYCLKEREGCCLNAHLLMRVTMTNQDQTKFLLFNFLKKPFLSMDQVICFETGSFTIWGHPRMTSVVFRTLVDGPIVKFECFFHAILIINFLFPNKQSIEVRISEMHTSLTYRTRAIKGRRHC